MAFVCVADVCSISIMDTPVAQPSSPPRGFFTWHADMTRLDSRVTSLNDRLSSLEGTCLKDGDMRTLNTKQSLLETRMQHLAEILDEHSALLAKHASLNTEPENNAGDSSPAEDATHDSAPSAPPMLAEDYNISTPVHANANARQPSLDVLHDILSAVANDVSQPILQLRMDVYDRLPPPGQPSVTAGSLPQVGLVQ